MANYTTKNVAFLSNDSNENLGFQNFLLGAKCNFDKVILQAITPVVHTVKEGANKGKQLCCFDIEIGSPVTGEFRTERFWPANAAKPEEMANFTKIDAADLKIRYGFWKESEQQPDGTMKETWKISQKWTAVTEDGDNWTSHTGEAYKFKES